MKKKQGARVRATDSRGRVIKGLYIRDNRFTAGFQDRDRWQMVTLKATTITEARRERESLVAGLREGRVASRDGSTFAECFAEYQDARSLADRTRDHEQHLVDRHLATMKGRRVQDVAPSDIAKVLRGMRDTYSPWTCTAVYRVVVGTFALATRRGIITRNPIDGLAPSEKPRQRNAKKIAVLDSASMEKLIEAAASERWRAAIALAGFAGLRLGEIRGLRWGDVDLDANTLTVSRSLLPDGTAKLPKTSAGVRTIPLLPAARRALVAWKIKSPHTAPENYVLVTHDGSPVQERNLRRALDAAKTKATIDVGEERLSWHSLRHSYASMLATDLELPATTLARLTGHADAGFTLKVYAKDGRDEQAVVTDVLKRAASAQVGR